MSATKELRELLDSHGVEVRLHKPVTKAELARENAELRELVRDMMRFFEDDDACSHCGHDVECSEQSGLVLAYEEDCLMREVFKNRMRELGVEVD